jgi:hypothetical protein
MQAGLAPNDLLKSVPVHPRQAEPNSSASLSSSWMLTAPSAADETENDGLIVSPAPVKVIELPMQPEPPAPVDARNDDVRSAGTAVELGWLAQPLSRRGIAWFVNTLTVLAALLLFALIFLSITREIPKRPVTMAVGAAAAVIVLYWGFFKVFGDASPGARLARLTGYGREEEKGSGCIRFR